MIPMISFILSNQLYHLFLKVLAVRCIIYALFTKMNVLVQLCTWMIKQAKLEHLVCNSVVQHWFRSHQIRAAKLVSHGLNVSNLSLCLQEIWSEASSCGDRICHNGFFLHNSSLKYCENSPPVSTGRWLRSISLLELQFSWG